MVSTFKKQKGINQEDGFLGKNLAFIDIETTGLDPQKHEIIEISCLIVDPRSLEVKKEYLAKILPEHLETADPIALEINHFSLEAWKSAGAKLLAEVLEDLNKLSPGAIIVGYNVSFDRSFIENAARKNNILLEFDYHWLDVMSLVYFNLLPYKNLSKLKLSSVCQSLGLPHHHAHTALGDIQATLAVFRYLRSLSRQ